MDTFQAVIFSFFTACATLLPLGPGTNQAALAFLLRWQAPGEFFLGITQLGVFLGLAWYLRHDILSQLASILGLVVYRKLPNTVDERFPFLVLLGFLTYLLGREGIDLLLTLPSHWVQDWPIARGTFINSSFEWPLLWSAAGLAFFGLPLVWVQNWGMKNRILPAFNWIDAVAIGFGLVFGGLPFAGALWGALFFSFLRGFNREAALKIAYLVFLPHLGVELYHRVSDYSFGSVRRLGLPDGLNSLTIGVGFAVAFFTGLLLVTAFSKASTVGLMRDPAPKSFGRFLSYRLALGLGIAVVTWIRTQ